MGQNIEIHRDWRGCKSVGGNTGKAEWRQDGRKRRWIQDILDLPAGWEELIEAEMTQGAGIYEVMALLYISEPTFNRWMKEHEEFRDVIEAGLSYARAWFERVGRYNLANFKFKDNLYKFIMATRFNVGAEALPARGGAKKAAEAETVGNIEVNDEILSDLFSGGEGNPPAVS